MRHRSGYAQKFIARGLASEGLTLAWIQEEVIETLARYV